MGYQGFLDYLYDEPIFVAFLTLLCEKFEHPPQTVYFALFALFETNKLTKS